MWAFKSANLSYQPKSKHTHTHTHTHIWKPDCNHKVKTYSRYTEDNEKGV